MLTKQMKLSIGVFLFIVLSNAATAFSDSELEARLSQLDAAVENRDVAVVADVLSDSAIIAVEIPTPQGNVQVELNKEQYLQALAQGWETIDGSYTYTRKTTQIKSNGVVAQVVSVVKEEYQAGGQIVSSETLEVADFAVENGKLVVIKVVGQMHVDGNPIPKPSI